MGIATLILISSLFTGALTTDVQCGIDNLNEKQCLERGIEVKSEYPRPINQRK